MNVCCKEEIEPSLTLKRMISFLKFVVFLHFVIITFDFLIAQTGFYLLFIFQVIVFSFGICKKHFGYFLYFIMFLYFYIFLLFYILIEPFQTGLSSSDSKFIFCFYVFLLVFEIFCVYAVFQVYKQAKYEYRNQYGFNADNDDEENNNDNDNNNNNNNNNNNEDLAPFQEL